MPPFEAYLFLVSLLLSWSRTGNIKVRTPYKLAFFDIKRAHFYGEARREIHVDLVEEDREEYGEDKCGLLLKSMYGTQDAAQIWQED